MTRSSPANTTTSSRKKSNPKQLLLSKNNNSTPSSKNNASRRKSKDGFSPKTPIDLTSFGFSRSTTKSAGKKRASAGSGAASLSSSTLLLSASKNASIRNNNNNNNNNNVREVVIVSQSSSSMMDDNDAAVVVAVEDTTTMASPPKRARLAKTVVGKENPEYPQQQRSTTSKYTTPSKQQQQQQQHSVMDAGNNGKASGSSCGNGIIHGVATRAPLLDLTQSSSSESANSFGTTHDASSIARSKSGGAKANNVKSIQKSNRGRGSLDAPIVIHSDGNVKDDDDSPLQQVRTKKGESSARTSSSTPSSKKESTNKKKATTPASAAASVASFDSATQSIEKPQSLARLREKYAAASAAASLNHSQSSSTPAPPLQKTPPSTKKSRSITSFFSNSPTTTTNLDNNSGRTINGDSGNCDNSSFQTAREDDSFDTAKSSQSIGEKLSPIQLLQSNSSTAAAATTINGKSSCSKRKTPSFMASTHNLNNANTLSKTTASPAPAPTHTKPIKTRKAIGLVRVPNHNRVACSTAVAQAKSQLHPFTTKSTSNNTNNSNHTNNSNNSKTNFCTTPRPLFSGAILGRTSSTSSKNSSFVDLGIDAKCAGISRKHIQILSVYGLDDGIVKESRTNNSRGGDEEEASMCTRSVTSKSIASRGTAATHVTNGSSNTQSSSPLSMTIQVVPSSRAQKETNGVNFYRTRRGHRKSLFLKEGQKCTLRVGDAMEFYSNVTLYFCVVELNVVCEEEDEVVEVVEEMEVENVTKAAEKEVEKVQERAQARMQKEKKKRHASDSTNGKAIVGEEVVEIMDVDIDEDEAKLKKISRNNVIDIEDDDPMDISGVTKKVGNSKLSEEEVTLASVKVNGVKKQLPKVPQSNKNPAIGNARDGVPPSTTVVTKDQHANETMDHNVDFTHERDDDNLDETMELEKKPLSKQEELMKVEASIKKHDQVRVPFIDPDCFGVSQLQWFFGKVIDARKVPGSMPKSYKIKVEFDDKQIMKFDFPSISDGLEIEIIQRSTLDEDPESIYIGDFVDCFYQNGGSKGKWFRGRVANISDDGSRCDVAYNDGEYESNIPTKEKKIRLIQHCDSTGEWLKGKSVLICDEDGKANKFRSGTVTTVQTVQMNIPNDESNQPFLGHDSSRVCQVTFSDGSTDVVSCNKAAKSAFTHIWKKCAPEVRRVWPVASTTSMAETVRLRRQTKDRERAINESDNVIKVKTEPNGSITKATTNGKNGAPRSSRRTKMKVEPEDEIEKETAAVTINAAETKAIKSAVKPQVRSKKGSKAIGDHHVKFKEEPDVAEDESQFDSQDSATAAALFGDKEKANDLPPTLPNVLWCALNSPEADTGAIFLRDLLCVHNSVPPIPMTLKLMDLMKYGPKADGCKVYFKDPHRTELAAEYVFGLLTASSRLVRRDGTALFGPSSWDDIDVLLSQSIDQTENMISGRRLAQGLQLAARGAKLISLMLRSELKDTDLSSTSICVFNSLSLKCKPSIKSLKMHSVRNGLKAAVRNATSCLVRHSRWILDDYSNDIPVTMCISDESCSLDASDCLDSLGSSICFFAWLFCAEEGIELSDPLCAYLIKDEFLNELERGLDHAPEMNERSKKIHVKKLKLRFLESLIEDFAAPIVMGVGQMIDLADELAMVGA